MAKGKGTYMEDDLKERIRALEKRVDNHDTQILEILSAMELWCQVAKKTANLLEKLK